MLTISQSFNAQQKPSLKKNTPFKGLNFEIAHLIKDKSFKEGQDLFINNEKRNTVNIKGEIHAIGHSSFKKIHSKIAELFDKTKSQIIKAKYISLFDNSKAKELYAEISASIHTKGKVNKVISQGDIDAQADIGGRIDEMQAKDYILIGQNTSVGKATAPTIEVINNATVSEMNTNLAKISGASKITNKITSEDSVRVRENAEVNYISTGYHLGLSGDAKIGRAILQGNHAEVHIMDNPQYELIEFKKGNGKVILHPDYRGDFPEINPDKIKGATIEKTEKKAISHLRPFSDINEFLEYEINF